MQKSFLSITFLVLYISVFADTIPVNTWLFVPGPSPAMPAFSETKNMEGKVFDADRLFAFNPFDIKGHYPRENNIFPGSDASENRWKIVEVNDSGFISLAKEDKSHYHSAYVAAYITAGRWINPELEIHSRQRFEVLLNGKSLGLKNTSQQQADEPGKWTQKIELEQGKHLLLIRTFSESGDESLWQLSASLNIPGWSEIKDLKTEISPEQGKTINHLLDGIKAGTASLSPEGDLYAVNFSRILPPSDSRESWLDIKRVADGKLVHSFRHANISSFSWASEGRVISYRTTRDGKSTLWMHDLENGSYHAILEDIEELGSYSWSPDGSFIIYSVNEKLPDDNGPMNRVTGMQDRLPGFRTRQFLHKVNIDTGIKERLTHGFLTTSLHDISPDGKTILFGQSRPDYSEIPYSKHDIFIMDLTTRETDTILSDKKWGVSGRFSPDGKQILFTGGPSAFDGAGENVPEGMIANNYDTQAYIFDLSTGSVDPVTRDFDPSISQARWSRSDNLIYFLAGNEDLMHLFSYNPRNRKFTKMDTGEDVVNWINLAQKEPFAVYAGSGISTPPKISLLNLKNGRYRELENPDKDNFRNVVFGSNFEWDFQNAEGLRIPGRVYLPPDFDKTKKYPLIVYYYGGTTPVSRSFGGRYPFNLYAANGYVVYVLQPSGAIGFGQEFSAAHVNNWGITVADEIIDGTRKFLEDHSFIDYERVGCMGASYGGFMTMLLTTRTDLFAAAISHAGISSLSSYWGEGYWGYSYSAVASAGSFPWNNRELYVDQSPLFSADRINTPLLLVHGDSDTNVPPGESIQLYVALKLLGRPVELVKVEGEDHHILTYSKRIKWNNTKLAWFDKWLKGEPQWWEEQYPDKNL